jgi:predicted metal-binding membrane protein
MSTRSLADGIFFAVSALLFGASATLTIAWCASMSSMSEMPMPGGWSMSMTWMRMPGQTWLDAAGSFLAMWFVMMVAMMLPSLMPVLWRYRSASRDANHLRVVWLTTVVGSAYFLVWALIGALAFPVGVVIASLAMRLPAYARAVPLAVGILVVCAGALQFTAWKGRWLRCCRAARVVQPNVFYDVRGAWRYGLRHGVHCSYCCLGLTVTLLLLGVMSLEVMAVVTVAVTLERLAPHGERVARTIGVAVVAVGCGLIVKALAVV